MTRAEFLVELEKGKKYEVLVRDALRAAGLAADLGAESLEPDDPEHDYANQQDVVVNPGQIGIEVKSQQHAWYGLSDFRFDHALGLKVSRWNRMTLKPYAVVHISRPTHAMIVSPVSSFPHWIVLPMRDELDGIMKDCFLTPVEFVVPFTSLVVVLRKLTGGRYVPPSREQLEAEAKGRRRQLYVRERALISNAKDGYVRPGHTKRELYTPPTEFVALEAEFAHEVPDEEWQLSPWRKQ